MDTDDPAVALCAEGMRAEAQGDPAAARAAFGRAWEASVDTYGAVVAAHYLARHQPDAADTLRWNRRALDLATDLEPATIAPLLPSLHLVLGASLEETGDRAAAREQFLAAERATASLPDDAYAVMVRDGITRGLERTADLA